MSALSIVYISKRLRKVATILTEAVPAWQVLISLVFLCLFAVHGADLDLLMRVAATPNPHSWGDEGSFSH